MEEEIITHFSHEHSLILLKHVDEKYWCYGCNQKLSMEKEQGYICDRRGCETIFLHKQCAELPREIMHPLHEKHSVILLASQPYGAFPSYCDVCRTKMDGFNYYCSICDFNVDVKCTLKEKEALFVHTNKKFKHPSHEHLLNYQPRPASFRCSACNAQDMDHSYQCSIYGCPFWIHKTCALLPGTSKRNDHDHPLQLIYKLSSEYFSFFFYCDVCGGRIPPIHWAYYCRPCRYFVHIKCMTSPKLRSGDNYLYDHNDATFEERMLKLLLPVDFLHLPIADESVELIQRFLLRKNRLSRIAPMIEISMHPQHPLTLSRGNTEDADEDIICDGCNRPISTTHYCCRECKFFLHLQCAVLPVKLLHPGHPHPLALSFSDKFYNTLQCDLCHGPTNGYLFQCEICKFRIDIKCACMQTMISHETHDHPLFHTTVDSSITCSGCRKRSSIDSLYACDPCNFYLHFNCVMLPKTLRHRFDYKHRIELSFPPYPDHPEPFDCLECEEEPNPNGWLYRCKECDLHFHSNCPIDAKNVKFGQNLQISSHTHPLKFVFSVSVKSPCHGCGNHMLWPYAFECETCNFHLCTKCIHTRS